MGRAVGALQVVLPHDFKLHLENLKSQRSQNATIEEEEALELEILKLEMHTAREKLRAGAWQPSSQPWQRICITS